MNCSVYYGIAIYDLVYTYLVDILFLGIPAGCRRCELSGKIRARKRRVR